MSTEKVPLFLLFVCFKMYLSNNRKNNEMKIFSLLIATKKVFLVVVTVKLGLLLGCWDKHFPLGESVGVGHS